MVAGKEEQESVDMGAVLGSTKLSNDDGVGMVVEEYGRGLKTKYKHWFLY